MAMTLDPKFVLERLHRRSLDYRTITEKIRAELSPKTETFVIPGSFSEVSKDMSDREFKILTEVEMQLLRASPDERKVILKRLRKEYAHKKHVHDENIKENLRKRAQINRVIAAIMDVESKIGAGMRLEKPRSPSFQELRRVTSRNEVMYADKEDVQNNDGLNLRWEKEVFRHINHFVVEHDWAAAFARANLGNFKLPYGYCAFDFQVSGVSVIGFAFQDEGDPTIGISTAIKSSAGWILPAMKAALLDEILSSSDGGLCALVRFVAKQIRAVSIALDSEIAVTSVTRAPYSGKAPIDGKPLPPISYHVVSLAKRQRAAPRVDSHPTGRHVRLHFRRGHWRHYENVKTWIKWMLVGDPDLGFVDKHYRI